MPFAASIAGSSSLFDPVMHRVSTVRVPDSSAHFDLDRVVEIVVERTAAMEGIAQYLFAGDRLKVVGDKKCVFSLRYRILLGPRAAGGIVAKLASTNAQAASREKERSSLLLKTVS